MKSIKISWWFAKASLDVHRTFAVIGTFCLVMFWINLVWAEQTSGKDEVSSLHQSGQEQLDACHFQEAQSFFKKALEKDPSHCPSFMGLLHAHLFLEDLRGIHELLPRSLSLEGCTATDEDYLEALRAEAGGNWSRALSRYEAIAKRDPSDARALVYMALIHLGLKEYTAGIKACQQAIKADSHFFLAHNVLGRLALAQGDLAMAIPEFEKALEAFPDYPLGHASLGDAYLREGMQEKAKAEFQEAERLDPENADLLAFIGNAFLESGKKEDAVYQYQKSLAVNPENSMVHYFLARIYFQEGRDEKVEEEVEATVRFAPYLHEIYRQFANMYLERNNLGRAEKYFKKQIDLEPGDLQARNSLSWVYFVRGDYDRAEAQAREMIQRDPQLINGYNNLGHVLIEKGMFTAAIEQFQRGIAIRADVCELHAGLALAFLRRGQLEEAEAAAEEALKLQPNAADPHLILGLVFCRKRIFDEAQAEVEFLSKEADGAMHLAFYLEGQIELEKGDYEKAVAAFRKAGNAFPPMLSEFLRGEALVHLKTGAIDDAVEASLKAIELNPSFALSYRDLGVAFRAQGREKEAREALQKFLQLWGGADSDNAEVIETRRILAELGS